MTDAFFQPYYGNYRSRTFSDIFYSEEGDSFDYFKEKFNETTFSGCVSNDYLEKIFWLLYARYGNSHIASSDENQFVYKLAATIYSYGPNWARKMEIQSDLRSMTMDQIRDGGKTINNHSYNPSTAPSTSSLDELTTIDDQNTSNYRKSALSASTELWAILNSDITKEFTDKFKKLFLTIVNPELPLWYVSEEGE